MLLTYQKGDGTEATVRLRTITHASPITIGRDKTANLMIDDPECSRIHTAIRYWDDIFIVRDMNSRNGTFLNGKKIDVARLNPGDVIKIGATEILVSSDPTTSSDVTQVAQPPPVQKR